MRNKYKIHAFTILEMVITMMVSALLIGLALTAYMVVYRSYLSFEKKNGETSDILQMDRTLQRDFARSQHVYSSPEGLILYGRDTLFYDFKAAYIVRRSARADTFHVEVRDVQALFENKPLAAGDSLIDRLSFRLVLRKDTIPFIYHKLYSSEELFN